MAAAATGAGAGDGRRLRWGILSTADIGAQKVIPGLRKPAAARSSRSRRATRPRRAVADELGIPTRPRLVRGAPRRPGRRRRLHPAAEPPPRRVDDRRGPRRQARPVREAAGHDRRRRRADGRRLRGAGVRLMEAFMYRHHPSWVAVSELVASGRIGRLRAVQSWFSYYNDDPANIRNQLEPAAAPCSTSAATRSTCRGCCSTPSRVAVRASIVPRPGDRRGRPDQRDPRVRRRQSPRSPARPGSRPTSGSTSTDRRAALDRHPVQHPARPADARVRRRRRRSAGRAGRPRR